MPIELSWYIPSRVLYVRSYGVSTTEDVLAINRRYEDFFQEGTPPLYLISDETEIEQTNLSLAAVKDSFSFLTRFDYVLSVGKQDRVGTFLTSALSYIFRYKYKRVPTMEEAIRFLKEHDPTLVEQSSQNTPSA